MDKYGINFSDEAKARDLTRLVNQLWKLIPMRENKEDWHSQLATLLEELTGLAELYRNKPDGLVLISKLEGLTSDVCEDFMLYRKTVFRCIELLNRVLKDDKPRIDA